MIIQSKWAYLRDLWKHPQPLALAVALLLYIAIVVAITAWLLP